MAIQLPMSIPGLTSESNEQGSGKMKAVDESPENCSTYRHLFRQVVLSMPAGATDKADNR
jgi:hypothetical protein